MHSTSAVYVSSSTEYDKYREKLKLVPCPKCRAVGNLNRHGYLRGYDEHEKVKRGWRVFCSDRHLRGGCGKTYSVIQAQFLFRRIVDTRRVWELLKGMLKGLSVKAAWEKVASPFSLETGYRLRDAFSRSQSFIRTMLMRNGKLPKFSTADAELQVIEHLRAAFLKSACPVADFQVTFQTAFLRPRVSNVNRSG